MVKPKWEKVHETGSRETWDRDTLEKFPVPGGWIFRSTQLHTKPMAATESTVFVPKPRGKDMTW